MDAAILFAAAFGQSRPLIRQVASRLHLLTTERALEEVRRRVIHGVRHPQALSVLESIADELEIPASSDFADAISAAETALREAVPSRNGSVRDAHILALAWAADADVWSTDRDFAGTGVATWSTPNLIRALAEAGGL